MLKGITVAITVLCLLLPASTWAQGFTPGSKEILLNGAGVSDKDFDSTVFSIEGSFGYFFTRSIEVSVRQAVAATHVENEGSSWNAATRVAGDYHFDLGRWWPFVGANIGYIYGDDVTDTWEAGLEGGLKFFVNSTTFVLGMLEYEWFLDNDSDDGFSDGQWLYIIGLGFKW